MEELAIEYAVLTMKEKHDKSRSSVRSKMRRSVGDVRYEQQYEQKLQHIKQSPLLCSTLQDRTLQRRTAVSEKTTDERIIVEMSVRYVRRRRDGCIWILLPLK